MKLVAKRDNDCCRREKRHFMFLFFEKYASRDKLDQIGCDKILHMIFYPERCVSVLLFVIGEAVLCYSILHKWYIL